MTLNPHAWSRVANVIYLDSPAGVGLSYSETHADYTTNDTHTAQDAEAFLRRFFEEYPDFQRNKFYIAGPPRRRSSCHHTLSSLHEWKSLCSVHASKAAPIRAA